MDYIFQTWNLIFWLLNSQTCVEQSPLGNGQVTITYSVKVSFKLYWILLNNIFKWK